MKSRLAYEFREGGYARLFARRLKAELACNIGDQLLEPLGAAQSERPGAGASPPPESCRGASAAHVAAWRNALDDLLAVQAHNPTMRLPLSSLLEMEQLLGITPPDPTVLDDPEARREFFASLSDTDYVYLRDAAKSLFDLGTGPVSFEGRDVGSEPDSGCADAEERQASAPGLLVDQRVLCDTDGGASPSLTLDDFAKGVVEDRRYDDIYCLSGPRGSGKSTALNRTAWFARNWVRGRPRPLLVRFDLGTAFDGRKFTLDLLTEICRSAIAHCRRPPLAPASGCSWVVRLLGHLGHWCAANLRWALLVGFLGGLYFAVQRVGEDPAIPPPFVAASVLIGSVIVLGVWYSVTAKLRNRSRPDGILAALRRMSPWWLAALVLWVPVLLCIAQLIGTADHLSPFAVRPTPWRLSRSETVGALVSIAAARAGDATVVDSATIRTALDEVENALALPPRVSEELHANLAPLLGGWCVWMASLALGMLLLPRWWDDYVHYRSQIEALRTKHGAQMTPQLPYLSNVASLASSLLPQSVDAVDLRDTDVPFLQEQLRQLLARSASTFSRVVVLIDDVDVLPSRYFHEFFRLMRPFSKVQGVVCVVCVPQYFHEALRASSLLSDIHSSVRQSYLLGDPRWTDRKSTAVQALWRDGEMTAECIDEIAELLRSAVLELFRARCRLRLEPVAIETLESRSAVFGLLIDRWLARRDVATWGHLRRILRRVASSRREILRETELLLDERRRTPFLEATRAAEARRKTEFEASKAAYFRSEHALEGDISERARTEAAYSDLATRGILPPLANPEQRAPSVEGSAGISRLSDGSS